MQLLWPDSKGRYPWEEKAGPRVRTATTAVDPETRPPTWDLDRSRLHRPIAATRYRRPQAWQHNREDLSPLWLSRPNPQHIDSRHFARVISNFSVHFSASARNVKNGRSATTALPSSAPRTGRHWTDVNSAGCWCLHLGFDWLAFPLWLGCCLAAGSSAFSGLACVRQNCSTLEGPPAAFASSSKGLLSSALARPSGPFPR